MTDDCHIYCHCHCMCCHCMCFHCIVVQVMDLEGKVLPGAKAPALSEEKLRKMYQTMVRVQCLDDVFYNAQVCNVVCGVVCGVYSRSLAPRLYWV
jgi:hypothetical protein